MSFEDFKRFEDYKRTNLTQAVDSLCQKHKVPRINLFDAFKNQDPKNLYIPGDNHWNDRGQDMAAKRTATYIVNNALF